MFTFAVFQGIWRLIEHTQRKHSQRQMYTLHIYLINDAYHWCYVVFVTITQGFLSRQRRTQHIQTEHRHFTSSHNNFFYPLWISPGNTFNRTHSITHILQSMTEAFPDTHTAESQRCRELFFTLWFITFPYAEVTYVHIRLQSKLRPQRGGSMNAGNPVQFRPVHPATLLISAEGPLLFSPLCVWVSAHTFVAKYGWKSSLSK